MREVGQLVGRDDTIDDRRAVDLERCLDCGVQLAGLCGLKAFTATSAGKRHKIRIGKFDARPIGWQAYALSFQSDQPERRVVVDDNLYRKLVVRGSQELAHEHVESAIAAKRDHLAGAIERLNAIGLAERRSDRGVIE